jgi:hypothetical protein
MNGYHRFRLVQEYTCELGTLPYGSEIDILGDRIMFNGGMVEPQYYGILATLVTDKELSKKYVREVPIPYNKI